MSEALFRDGSAPELPLFDVHVNLLPPGAPAPTGFYAALTPAQAEGFGLAGACVSPPALDDLMDGNRRLLGWTTAHPGRWRPLARLGGRRGPRPVTGRWQVRAALRGAVRPREAMPPLDGFAGVKLMPPVSGVPDIEVLEEIGRRRLPVLVHAGALCPPAWIARRLLPRLRGPVILAHLGSWPCAAEALRDAVELAARDERVHLETSGASIGNFIAYAAGRVPGKVVFGSNAPMCPPAVQWAHVAAAVRDDRTLERIASGTARELFG